MARRSSSFSLPANSYKGAPTKHYPVPRAQATQTCLAYLGGNQRSASRVERGEYYWVAADLIDEQDCFEAAPEEPDADEGQDTGAERAGAEEASEPVCGAAKANGEPCTRETDGGYCWQHE